MRKSDQHKQSRTAITSVWRIKWMNVVFNVGFGFFRVAARLCGSQSTRQGALANFWFAFVFVARDVPHNRSFFIIWWVDRIRIVFLVPTAFVLAAVHVLIGIGEASEPERGGFHISCGDKIKHSFDELLKVSPMVRSNLQHTKYIRGENEHETRRA